MVPSVEYNEDSIAGKSRSPAHRYYTRSSRTQEPQSESRHPNERGKHRTTHQTTRKPVQLPIRQPQPSLDSPSNAENESDAQDLDSSQLDSMMDQVVYSTSNPLRAPFPSPAMKFTQPFHPSAPTQQGNQFAYSDGGWGGQHENNGSWHQTGVGGAGGQCILVEAANRAQMAILMDDMGNMGIEQMEQT
jgi:hypothetical protein